MPIQPLSEGIEDLEATAEVALALANAWWMIHELNMLKENMLKEGWELLWELDIVSNLVSTWPQLTMRDGICLVSTVMKLLLFRHHVSPRVTSMLSDFIPYAICFILLPYAYLLTLSLSSSLTSYAYSFHTRNSTGSMLTDLLLIYDFIHSSAVLLRIMLLLRYWLVTFYLASSSFHILSSNRMVRSSLT